MAKSKIEIRVSKIEGRGCFASCNIKKGETVCIMRGKQVSIPMLKKDYSEGKTRIDDPLQISDKIYLKLKVPFIYINHSCSPTSCIVKSDKLVAFKNIKKGEEITFDYSLTEWTDDSIWGINWQEIWGFQCNCGAKNCRRKIKEFPKLPEKIKKAYSDSGMLPDFILKKIKKQT
ncbi:MAG: SET domain-containing protein [Candidatus ainarchaeum sp.]|nr:SET domain-containing protein [Candidatus ainarchaeum sp.]